MSAYFGSYPPRYGGDLRSMGTEYARKHARAALGYIRQRGLDYLSSASQRGINALGTRYGFGVRKVRKLIGPRNMSPRQRAYHAFVKANIARGTGNPKQALRDVAALWVAQNGISPNGPKYGPRNRPRARKPRRKAGSGLYL